MLKYKDNKWIEDGEEIKTMFQVHLKNILTTKLNSSDWLHTSYRFPSFDNSVTRLLKTDLQDFKIKQALFDMTAWKSPGPNGFSTGFYQNIWNLTSENTNSFIQQLWHMKASLEDINFSDICLIPKLENPTCNSA
ncbi:unnamed protein product [Lathyrus sativus]|nr:unnamed protein product [Lathyrus sativus]